MSKVDGFATHVTSTRMLGNADLRRHNLSAVLRAVRDNSGCGRVELARITGLTKTAVGGIVNDLVGYGLLVEEANPAQRLGRPSPRLRLARERFAAVVIDVGVTYVTTTLCDLGGRVVTQETDLNQETGSYDLLARLDLIGSRASDAQEKARHAGLHLSGVVLAVHGITDPEHGTLLRRSVGRELDLAEELASRMPDCPAHVLVENDSYLAALAEWDRHRLSGARNLVALSGELALGAGIVLDGRLYRGSHGYAARFGHMVVDPRGPACACGRAGCWSVMVGLRHVLRDALPDVAGGLERIPGYAAVGQNALLAAARSNDRRAVRALARAGAWLGEGAANIVNSLDPDVIVAGAYVPALSEWVLPAAWESLRKSTVRRGEPEKLLVASDLDTAAYHSPNADLERTRVVGGGLHCVTERLLADPGSHALPG